MNAHVSAELVGEPIEKPRPDPIMAAIDSCRAALEVYDRTCDEDKTDGEGPEVRLSSAAFNSAWAMVRVIRPTTVEGVGALARFGREVGNHLSADDFEEHVIGSLCRLGEPA